MTATVTAKTMYGHLVQVLGLESRTITFHILEPSGEIGSGMIPDWETINNSGAFNAVADSACDDPYVYVLSCTTYQLGSGESDAAGSRDLYALECARKVAPEAFDAMIADYADNLFNLSDGNVANPAYDEDELEWEGE